MIQRFIRRVLGLRAPGPIRIPKARHSLARNRISPAALKVCEGLRAAGFQAYVVGGAVRDVLLGATPKDFDVATDARPEQVKPLFRRALLIGRRFRLVHVMIGGETVEVSTFRAAQPAPEANDDARVTNTSSVATTGTTQAIAVTMQIGGEHANDPRIGPDRIVEKHRLSSLV